MTKKQTLPKQMQLVDHGSYVEIVRSWRGVIAVIVTAVTCLWWFVLSKFIPQLPVELNASEPMRFVPYLHVIIGVFLLYYTAALWVNKTYIFVNLSRLEIVHGPLPWFGHRIVETPDIKGLYVKQIGGKSQNGALRSYHLHAKTRSSMDVKLLSGLASPAQALFVEKQLEKTLNIKTPQALGKAPQALGKTQQA